MRILLIGYQTLHAYVRDRILHALGILSLLLVCFSAMLSSLTIVEQQKILLDFGLAAVSLVGITFSILLGSTVVRKEIENRTIYSVLAKPVARYEYVLGKFLGAVFVLSIIHLLAGFILGAIAFYESGVWPSGLWAAVYLMTLESCLVLALSLAFSLFFSSPFLSVIISFSTFLVGRSNSSFLVLSQKAESEVMKRVAKVLHDVTPALQRFDIRDIVAYGKPYPEGAISMGSVYFFFYLLFLLSASLLLMQRKDLN